MDTYFKQEYYETIANFYESLLQDYRESLFSDELIDDRFVYNLSQLIERTDRMNNVDTLGDLIQLLWEAFNMLRNGTQKTIELLGSILKIVNHTSLYHPGGDKKGYIENKFPFFAEDGAKEIGSPINAFLSAMFDMSIDLGTILTKVVLQPEEILKDIKSSMMFIKYMTDEGIISLVNKWRKQYIEFCKRDGEEAVTLSVYSLSYLGLLLGLGGKVKMPPNVISYTIEKVGQGVGKMRYLRDKKNFEAYTENIKEMEGTLGEYEEQVLKHIEGIQKILKNNTNIFHSREGEIEGVIDRIRENYVYLSKNFHTKGIKNYLDEKRKIVAELQKFDIQREFYSSGNKNLLIFADYKDQQGRWFVSKYVRLELQGTKKGKKVINIMDNKEKSIEQMKKQYVAISDKGAKEKMQRKIQLQEEQLKQYQEEVVTPLAMKIADAINLRERDFHLKSSMDSFLERVSGKSLNMSLSEQQMENNIRKQLFETHTFFSKNMNDIAREVRIRRKLYKKLCASCRREQTKLEEILAKVEGLKKQGIKSADMEDLLKAQDKQFFLLESKASHALEVESYLQYYDDRYSRNLLCRLSNTFDSHNIIFHMVSARKMYYAQMNTIGKEEIPVLMNKSSEKWIKRMETSKQGIEETSRLGFNANTFILGMGVLGLKLDNYYTGEFTRENIVQKLEKIGEIGDNKGILKVLSREFQAIEENGIIDKGKIQGYIFLQIEKFIETNEIHLFDMEKIRYILKNGSESIPKAWRERNAMELQIAKNIEQAADEYIDIKVNGVRLRENLTNEKGKLEFKTFTDEIEYRIGTPINERQRKELERLEDTE